MSRCPHRNLLQGSNGLRKDNMWCAPALARRTEIDNLGDVGVFLSVNKLAGVRELCAF